MNTKLIEEIKNYKREMKWCVFTCFVSFLLILYKFPEESGIWGLLLFGSIVYIYLYFDARKQLNLLSSSSSSPLVNKEEFLNKIKQALDNMSQEEKNKYFPADDKPKGWVSIDEHLPMWLAKDVAQGYSVYKVKDKNGNERHSPVNDHDVWYYMAKEAGITHWWNE